MSTMPEHCRTISIGSAQEWFADTGVRRALFAGVVLWWCSDAVSVVASTSVGVNAITKRLRRVAQIAGGVVLAWVLVATSVALYRLIVNPQPPVLFTRATLSQGKTYRYRVPIGGCAGTIVDVNDRNWKPATPWPYAPYPKRWHVTTEGSHYHTEQYLDGAVRLEPDRLVVSLPNGPIVKEYRPTAMLQGGCA